MKATSVITLLYLNQLRTQQFKRALCRGIEFGVDETNELITLYGTGHGHADAEIARCRDNNLGARLELMLLLCPFDHAKGGAILHAAARIGELQFGQQ